MGPLAPVILSVESLIALYSRSFTITVRAIHPSLIQPISISLSSLLMTIRTTPLVLSSYLEFFLFPLAVLGTIPVAELRCIRRRNRPAAQRNYTYHRLHRWNVDRARLIQDLLTPVPVMDSTSVPLVPHSFQSNLRRAERLIREDGQLGKALQALHSQGIADNSPATIAALRSKHPQSALPAHSGPLPSHALKVGSKHVLQQLQSFSRGTAGSRSGWRVSHFLALCQFQSFIAEFTSFINMFLSNRTPVELSALVVSGSLVPILKKDGGIRPVVVGEVFRRLISKLCVYSIRPDIMQYLQPIQLGVGLSGGTEAVLHAFNRAIRSEQLVSEDQILSLVDFENAFNEVSRQRFLDIILLRFPAIYPWVSFCYSIGAPLFVQRDIIYATTGVQQGDPLGPVLFALVLHPFLQHLRDVFSLKVGAILDDVTFLGSTSSTLRALEYLRSEGPGSGLRLSSKTCVWSPVGAPIHPSLQSFSLHDSRHIPVSVVSTPGVALLGSAVSSDPNFLNAIAMKRIQKWHSSIQLMLELKDPQLELMLLRACVGAPKIVYLLRTLPPQVLRPSIMDMEALIRSTLQRILVDDSPLFGSFQFQLATLPISHSGLGVYNPADISMFAYIASLNLTKHLQDQILHLVNDDPSFPTEYDVALQSFLAYVQPENNMLPQLTQTSLAKLFYQRRSSELLSSDYILSQPPELQRRFLAILQSVKQCHASAYLFALPNLRLNQVMSAQEFRCDMALRLLIPQFSGSRLCSRPLCTRPMDSFGYHALCCTGSSMNRRHDLVADALSAIAYDARLQPRRDAPVYCLGPSWRHRHGAGPGITAFRPADILLHFDGPRRTCVDITVVSPVLSAMPTQFRPGAAALRAEEAKYCKHLAACNAAGFRFRAFAVDALGVLAPDASALLTRLAHLLESTQGLPSYLARQLVFRRLSFAVHLGVARQLVARRELLPFGSDFLPLQRGASLGLILGSVTAT